MTARTRTKVSCWTVERSRKGSRGKVEVMKRTKAKRRIMYTVSRRIY